MRSLLKVYSISLLTLIKKPSTSHCYLHVPAKPIISNYIQPSTRVTFLRQQLSTAGEWKEMGKKRSRGGEAEIEDIQYTVKDGTRYVVPYVHSFATYAKGRWLGREIIEVLTREFGGNTNEYWESALRLGHIKINGQKVDRSYKFKNADSMLHMKHRHEPPVMGDILLVGENENMLAVCKPPSMPMHPCGAYRHNSLMFILNREPVIPNQPSLHLVHRLDRVTSGLVIIAKSKEAAAELSNEIKAKETQKTYLARVKGRFPKRLDHLRELSGEALWGGLEDDDEDGGGDEEGGGEGGVEGFSGARKKVNTRVASNSNVLSVAAEVEVGVAAEGGGQQLEIVQNVQTEKPKMSKLDEQAAKRARKEAAVAQAAQMVLDNMNAPLTKAVGSMEEVGSSENVGYGYDDMKRLVLRCPVGVINFRDGVHACRPDGKQAISTFTCLSYDAESDTSLVECKPYTGRTHQLRLHLQFLGNPIANDPCYGGTLFYGEQDKRDRALSVLKEMKKTGLKPLSKVPHIDDPELNAFVAELNANSTNPGSGKNDDDDDDTVNGTTGIASDYEQLPNESEQDYIVRTCRFCKNPVANELERLLHCDGIWLHALRYEGKGWCFEAPKPSWA